MSGSNKNKKNRTSGIKSGFFFQRDELHSE